MKKNIGYLLITVTIIMYILWLFTDIIKNLDRQIFMITVIIFPIIGVKLIRQDYLKRRKSAKK